MVWRITLYWIYKDQSISGINLSLYEVMFDCEAKIGLNSFPNDALIELSTGEELESILNKDEN